MEKIQIDIKDALERLQKQNYDLYLIM